MKIAIPVKDKPEKSDLNPHISWGLRKLVRSVLTDVVPRPSRWLGAFKIYLPVASDILTRRAYTKLLGYLSVGLPDEGRLVDLEALNRSFPKQVLKALRRRDEKHLSGLGATPWERVLVSRAREIIQYTNGKNLPGAGPAALENKAVPLRENGDAPLRILYVAHASLIDAQNGYAVRTHQLAAALKHVGIEVAVCARPQAVSAPMRVLDGVLYMGRAGCQCNTIADFLDAYVDSLEKQIEDFKPDIIHAASNWVTGAAASIVAKRHGLPFVYEVRGFWEITRLSSFPAYNKTAGFRAQKLLESEVAHRADRIATLSDLMVDELDRRGVVRDKIFWLPNCGAVQSVEEQSPARTEPISFGYVGSLVAYEGVDLLLKAFAVLRREGQLVKLIIAGGGPAEGSLKHLADILGIKEHVTFVGRFSPDDVSGIYKQISVIVLPRRDNPVTRLVSPLKPLEAMSFGKPCLVSDIPPLRYVACESRAGLTFKAGSRRSLVEVMRILSVDQERRHSLSSAGKAYISDQTWAKNALSLERVYRQLCGGVS